LKDSEIYFIIDFLIPIITAIIAIGYFLFVFPSVRGALILASEASGIDLVPMGEAVRVASICLFLGFSAQRIIMAYHQHRSRENLLRATEAGSRQLTEARKMLEEILRILRSSKRISI
jgi:hypothetical protein